MYRVSYDIMLINGKGTDDLKNWVKMNMSRFQEWSVKDYTIERPISGEPGRFLVRFRVESLDSWEEGFNEMSGTVIMSDLAGIAHIDETVIEVTTIIENED